LSTSFFSRRALSSARSEVAVICQPEEEVKAARAEYDEKKRREKAKEKKKAGD